MGCKTTSRSTIVSSSSFIRLLLLARTWQRHAADWGHAESSLPIDSVLPYGRMDRKPARQTGVRFSACTFFGMYLSTGQTPPGPVSARCGAEQQVTASDRRVPDKSYFKLHQTQCSPTLATFTPGFHAVQHYVCGKLVVTFGGSPGRPTIS